MNDRAPPESGEGGQVAGEGVDLSKAQEWQEVRHMLPNQMAGGAPFMSGPMGFPYPFGISNVCVLRICLDYKAQMSRLTDGPCSKFAAVYARYNVALCSWS